MLVIYIFYLLVYTGKDPENPDQTFLDIMEGSDSYAALLWGKDGLWYYFDSFESCLLPRYSHSLQGTMAGALVSRHWQ